MNTPIPCNAFNTSSLSSFFKSVNGFLLADWLMILQQCLFLSQPFLNFTSKSVWIPQFLQCLLTHVYFLVLVIWQTAFMKALVDDFTAISVLQRRKWWIRQPHKNLFKIIAISKNYNLNE